VTAVVLTPDGRRAVSASRDKALRVWELETGRLVRTLQGHGDRVTAVAIKGTREIRVILYAKEPSYVPRLDTRVNPSDFAGAPPVA
jgi:WD40 repeat protein